jgi:DNA (cytosine-5)-methyltransferase 1
VTCPACGSDTPTLVSLFDGIGGFPLAFSAAGYRVVAIVEIDKAAAGVASDRFPEAKYFPDVTEVTADDLIAAGFCPVCGVISAGFPCNDLSVAGRRAGLDGARSGLFFDVVRLARDLRCRWLVLENVPGLLSSVCPCPGDDACRTGCRAGHSVRGGACGPGRCVEIHGGAMGAVLGAVAELGYGFAYRVLDSSGTGTPQRRRRVYIVGHLGDWAAPAAVLLEPESGEGDAPPVDGPSVSHPRLPANGVGESGRQFRTLTAHGQRLDLETETFVVAGDAVRRLTPVEWERLQGLPDGWTAKSFGRLQDDSARYRQLGNSVAVPVVAWIARRMAAIAGR